MLFRNILAGIALVTTVASANAADLILTTEDFPPFSMKKGDEVVGVSTDVVKKLLERTKLTSTIELYPWARALSMAQNDANTCVFSAYRTEEREKNFKWVGPISSDDWTVFASTTKNISIKSLADLKAHTIGGVQDEAAATSLKADGYNVELAANHLTNFKKLESGRIDFLVTGKVTGQYLASQNGIKDTTPVLSFRDGAMYLACNKSVPDSVIDKLNTELKAMEQDGSLAAITKSYL